MIKLTDQEKYSKAVYDNLPKANNPDVKDFMQSLGITDKHPAEKYQDRIENSVEAHTARKEVSMKTQGIWRDATLFTVYEKGNKDWENLQERYNYWIKWLEEKRR